MKIILIGPAWPLRGGIANFNEALARNLMLEGHEVEIISFKLQYPKFLFPGKTQFDEGACPDDLKITTLINSVNPFNWGRTAKYIKSQKPDLVLVRYWLPFMAPSLGTIAAKLKKNTHVIAITDNVLPHEKRPGDRQFTAFFIKRCHAFIAMSKSVLSDLEKFDKEKPKVILPHPVYSIFGDAVKKEEARSFLKLNKEDNYLLFFGLIRQYKGLDLLIEAFALSDYKKHRLKLIVAGEFYSDKEKYLQRIDQLNLKEYILIKDQYIPSDQVKYYFCAANLITQTYRNATQSGVTQIAYHFGRPMLVTDVGGLAETVPDGKCGYVTKPDIQLIADAIDAYFEGQKETEFEANVLEEKKRFEWSYFIKGLFELNEKIKA